ncbi:NUDIX domain-containing protein [Alkalihalobacillus sp. FSL R5-0424]
MILRPMAVAFLINEYQEVLFLRKKDDATFLPGYLVPIGGHMEPVEINEPLRSCYREIEEETGLHKDQIEHLHLRYIIHRIKGLHDVRVQYVFLGEVSIHSPLVSSEEGTVEWVPLSNLNLNKVSETTRELIVHYKSHQQSESIYVGSMGKENGQPAMNWSILEDWEH